MVDLKITVDQLKNYLGTGLTLKMHSVAGVDHGTDKMIGICDNIEDQSDVWVKSQNGLTTDYKIQFAIPICYRLSDLDKEIEHNGERFVAEKELKKITKFSLGDKAGLIQFNGLITSFLIMKKLFEWHFWPFGDEYFEQGLVIDKRKEVFNG